MMAIGMILNLAKLKLDFNEHHREILIKETVDVSNISVLLKFSKSCDIPLISLKSPNL